MDKEKYSFLRPAGIETFAFIFSEGGLQWLHGTTTDDDGREISNRSRFQSVRRSIPKNSYQPNGAWVGSAYAACWTNWQGWNS